MGTFSHKLYVFFVGLLMGTADLIPGISGGTVAFVMGIYRELLKSITSLDLQAVRSLLSFKLQVFFGRVAWPFLVSLISGIFLAVILLSSTIDGALNEPGSRMLLFSSFFGLILGSVVHCMRKVEKWGWIQFGVLGLGVIVALFVTGIEAKDGERPYSAELKVANELHQPLRNYDSETQMITDLNEDELLFLVQKGAVEVDVLPDHLKSQTTLPYFNGWILICGMLGAMAMLLPGISGSYMLTILGSYPIVIAALSDVSGFIKGGALEWSSLFTLMNLFVGIALGLVLFSRVASWLIENYRATTLSLLTGFMIGAIGAVWPFRVSEFYLDPYHLGKGARLDVLGSYLPEWGSEELFWGLGASMVAFLFVMALEFLSSKFGRVASIS